MTNASGLLLLIVCANGAPVAAALLLGDRLAWPLDGGRRSWDGRPWLGPSKTWRGIFAALLVTPPLAVALGFSWAFGLIVAAGAMIGDCLASLIKRRLDRPSSSAVPLLDQIPEALIPLLLVQGLIASSLAEIAAVVILFTLVDLALTPITARLRRIVQCPRADPPG
jgi:CDP-2,3-bis-(O-geranylgeranyl)-sn-glycerol synthase